MVNRRRFLMTTFATLASGIIASASLSWGLDEQLEKEEISGKKVEWMAQEIVQETKRIARERGVALSDEQTEMIDREIPQSVRDAIKTQYVVIDP